MERFQLSVSVAPPPHANLVAYSAAPDQAACLQYTPHGAVTLLPKREIMWALDVDWAGSSNPFLAALPECIFYDVSAGSDGEALLNLMRVEFVTQRCGAQSVVNRLGEVLIVRLLRDLITKGTAEPGLLAGLSDPRLSRAIVAVHDQPGRNWSVSDLAREAGLSQSRFSEVFMATVGETPMGYLRRWRLVLAKQDLEKGARVEAVARRYAYGSPEAFARAFRKSFGVSPVKMRTLQQAHQP